MRGGRRHSLRTLRCRSLDAQASCEPGSLGRRPSTGSPSPPACLYNFLYHRSTPPNTALAGPPRPPVARTATLMSHGDNLDDLRRHPMRLNGYRGKRARRVPLRDMWRIARVLPPRAEPQGQPRAQRPRRQAHFVRRTTSGPPQLPPPPLDERRAYDSRSRPRSLARTVSQGTPWTPESRSARRRSISAAHASSTPSSRSLSRLSIRRPARSARSSSGSSEACLNRSRTVLTLGNVPQPLWAENGPACRPRPANLVLARRGRAC